MDVSTTLPDNRSASLKSARFLWLIIALSLALSLLGSVNMRAQDEVRPVTAIRVLWPSEWGVSHPAGLTYSDDFNQLHLLDKNNGATPNRATIVTITPFEDLVGSASVDFAIANPMNVAYDDIGERLFLLDTARAELAQVHVDAQGIAAPTTLVHFDVTALGIMDAQGMATDAARERLFILDSAAARIINLAIDAELAPDAAPANTIDLAHLAASELRGIAVHPASHHIYVANPLEDVLYELTATGQLVARYDLAGLDLVDLRGLAFGRSTDMTDSPQTVHLFMADAGTVNAGNTKSGTVGDGTVGDGTVDEEPVGGSIQDAANASALYIPLLSGQDQAVGAAGAPQTSDQATSSQVNGKILEVRLDPVECGCPVATSGPTATATPAGTPTPPESAFVLSVRVAHSHDDAEEQHGNGTRTIDIDSSDLELVHEGAIPQVAGIRFAGVPLPDNATIFDAYIEFTVDELDHGPTALVFHGEAADNSARFTTVDSNISDRAQTVNSVSWPNIPPWTGNHEKYRSPNLAPIVREIMARGGWHSGRAMTFIVTGSGERTAIAYDDEPDFAPRLIIEYGLPDPG